MGAGFCVGSRLLMSADAFVPTPTSKTIVLFRLRMKAQGTSAFAPQTTKPSDRRASTARPTAQCSAPTRTSRAVCAARASQASHKAIAISRISHDNIHNCTLSDSPSGHLSKRHIDARISSKSVPPRQEARGRAPKTAPPLQEASASLQPLSGPSHCPPKVSKRLLQAYFLPKRPALCKLASSPPHTQPMMGTLHPGVSSLGTT